ncbi:hypothetical protein SapgrDRAFT_1947 [Saprospira grandis DSM 2844]|uniref:Uncharacterized protein n=1 Tax=Saprospira grandis DSM 2844 TaxID=694433 RepID=J1I5J9_9BACT|nr:hypothetical protein SapgrDRAFT_1947 [Saprospira grandis DSM 2844]
MIFSFWGCPALRAGRSPLGSQVCSALQPPAAALVCRFAAPAGQLSRRPFGPFYCPPCRLKFTAEEENQKKKDR